MNINNIELKLEEAEVILTNKQLIVATRKEVEEGKAAIAERDRLRAERDAARDEAAGLRGALEEIKSEASVDISELDGNEGTCICCFCGGSWDSSMQPDHKQECPAATAAAALARTPAQHRDRIVAAGLRQLAEKMEAMDMDIGAEVARDEAERLEKGAGNG